MLCTLYTHIISVRNFQQPLIKSFPFTLLLVSAGLHRVTGIALGMVFLELDAVISRPQFP